MLPKFWLCFVPVFVAVDALGLLPLFIALTDGIDEARVRKLLMESMATALAVALAFVAMGKMVLAWLGISVADFMIAGGILLFLFSLGDILTMEKKQNRVDADNLGAVPLGVPLMVGPGVLATLLLLTNEYGGWPAAEAAVANILLAGATFSASKFLFRILGKAGSRIFSKLANLLLAAVAVMMVRKGLLAALGR